jgi:fatty acid desaturase
MRVGPSMLWSTQSGTSFFGGFGRLPLPQGKKGVFAALAIVTAAVAILLALVYFLGFAGLVLYVAVLTILVWRPLSRLEKDTQARDAALRQELRDAAAGSDTEFRLH